LPNDLSTVLSGWEGVIWGTREPGNLPVTIFVLQLQGESWETFQYREIFQLKSDIASNPAFTAGFYSFLDIVEVNMNQKELLENYVRKPMDIEKGSFEIITEEMGPHNFDEKTAPIVKRVIHTTADFEYADLLDFHPNAVEAGMKALREGSDIYADTNMVMAGINKKRLGEYGGKVYHRVHDEDVVIEAKERAITRSMVAIEKACKDENTKIYAIGNAPTALFTLIEEIQAGKVKPALIVGVPVGFVGAEESKELLRTLDIPYIVVRGRKGGSPVAATIINAMLYQL